MESGVTGPNRQCHFYIQGAPRVVIWALTNKPHILEQRISLAPAETSAVLPATLNYIHQGVIIPFYLQEATQTAVEFLREYSAQHKTPDFQPNLTLNHGQIQDHGEKSEIHQMHPAEALSYIGDVLHEQRIPSLLIFESPRPVVLEDDSGLAGKLAEIGKRAAQVAKRFKLPELLRGYDLF